MDKEYLNGLESRIPHGKVRTRFAPSPTGYMHVGNLRTALYTYFIARHAKGTFILRIEDTDQARKVEDAVDVIKRTLAGCGLSYDEGPDVGGPVAPYVQTERRGLYKDFAELLIERGHAYRCFCGKCEEEAEGDEPKAFRKTADPCRSLDPAEADRRAAGGESFVIRQRMPETGSTTFHDAVYGDITVDNSELEDQILLKSDGLPTYNFANVIDDHLMGITHVVRGSEYLSSAPKYNLLYEGFGWEIPTYVHCPAVMITDKETGAVRKMSKRHGDPSYEDLLSLGYLPEAIVNYVALLGWSPRGDKSETEFFDMDGLIDAFEIDGISKSPAAFDIEKLNYFNSTYLKELSAERFAELSRPWIDKAITAENVDKSLLPELLQTRLNKLSDIGEMVDFFNALPDYGRELFANKKNKLSEEDSLEILEKVYSAFAELKDWTYDSLHDALYSIAESTGSKIGRIMWPVRIAAAGKAVTPGGAIEICLILGRDETLRRFSVAFSKLGK